MIKRFMPALLGVVLAFTAFGIMELLAAIYPSDDVPILLFALIALVIALLGGAAFIRIEEKRQENGPTL